MSCYVCKNVTNTRVCDGSTLYMLLVTYSYVWEFVVCSVSPIFGLCYLVKLVMHVRVLVFS